MSARFISFSDLRAAMGIPYSRDHLRRLVKQGRFPAPVQLSAARIAWREADIHEWMAERAGQPTAAISA